MPALDLIERELIARGYITRREYPSQATASSKTEALRAIRSLQAALKNGKLRGISYVALYGIYELARIRAAGKKLSDGQKAAIEATFKQLKKAPGLFGKLRSFFKKDEESGDSQAQINELEDWLKSDEGFGEVPGSKSDTNPSESKPRRPRGWQPRAARQEAEREYYGDRPLKRKYGKDAPPKKVARVGASEFMLELEDGENFIGFDFQDGVATATTASNTLRCIRIVEKILQSKGGRKAVLAIVLGIHGILKGAAKRREGKLDKTDAQALNDSFEKLKDTKGITPELRDQLDELKTALERDNYFAKVSNADDVVKLAPKGKAKPAIKKH